MHPFSPFCSPNFAHHFPAHPVENTVPHSLFICQCPGARLLRPSHTSGTKDPCCPFCAFPASVLLEIRTCCLYQSCSPHIRSRTPFRTLFSSVNVPAPVSSGRPIRPVQKIRAALSVRSRRPSCLKYSFTVCGLSSAHPVENTVLHSLFICQCPGARLLRPSHTSGTKEPCCPFCAVLAFVLPAR